MKPKRHPKAWCNLYLIKWRFIPPLCILIFSLFNSFSSQAETPLANISDIHSIIQDKQGYIWFAGVHGLTRFDGTKSIRFAKNDPLWPIPDSWINSISPYQDKFLMATETKGAWLFDPSNGESTLIPIKIDNGNIYNIIYHDNYFYAYVNANTHLYQYSLSDKKTRTINNDMKITFLQGSDKFVYFSTLNSVYKIENGGIKKIYNESVTQIATIKNALFIASEKSILSYQDDGRQSSVILSEKITQLTPSYDQTSLIVVVESGAVYKLDTENLTPITHRYEVIHSPKIHQLYLDSNDVLWINDKAGIQRVTETPFLNHPNQYTTATDFISITTLNNELLIGTSGNGIHDFQQDNKLLPAHVNSFFSEKALKIVDLYTYKNKVFIATFDGLWVFNLYTQELNKLNLFPPNTILLSLKVSKDKLYIGTDSDGILIYDLISQITVDKLNQSDGLNGPETIDILPLINNTIWIAHSCGIDIYNIASRKVSQITNIGNSKVYSLAYADNKIFAATQSDGIFVYNLQGTLLDHFSNAVEFNSVKYIDGDIWAPSALGLYKINPETHQISLVPNTEQYTFTDSPVKLNNKIFIPHYKGILELPIEPTTSIDAKVYISKMNISGKSHLRNDAITLTSNNDMVLLELASLDYRPGKIKKYQYQINAGKWVPINGNQLTLAGLSPGTYHINIKGTNSLGQWIKNQAFTEINVAYPWYWTIPMRWFYIVFLLTVALITCWLLFLRFKSIKNIHDLLSEDIIIRGKSSLNVSKSLSNLLNVLEDKKTDENDNLFSNTLNKQKIASIIKECIDELSSHSQTQEPDALYGKNLSIALPYFKNFIKNKYHIHLSLKYELDEAKVSYEVQADLYKIIYEAITAAIINGVSRSFNVTVQEFKQKIWLTISDDEDSFVNYTNKIHFDMAMYFIRQIAKKHNASVNTFHEQGQGSQLLISMPLMTIS